MHVAAVKGIYGRGPLLITPSIVACNQVFTSVNNGPEAAPRPATCSGSVVVCMQAAVVGEPRAWGAPLAITRQSFASLSMRGHIKTGREGMHIKGMDDEHECDELCALRL